MVQALEKIFPHDQVSEKNTVFAAEIKNVGWLKTKKAIQGYSFLLIYVVSLAWVAWYLASDDNHSFARTRLLLLLLLALSMGFALASDIYCTQLALRPFREPDATTPDDSKETMVNARFALIQIRAWRLMALE